MTFISTVFAGIDLLAKKNFENGKIDVELGEAAVLFLENISVVNELGRFDRFYSSQNELKGLRLRKKNDHSIANQVDPQFLEAVKKSALAYMKILATTVTTTTDWKIPEGGSIRILKKRTKMDRIDINVFSLNFPEKTDLGLRILNEIIAQNGVVDVKVAKQPIKEHLIIFGNEQNLALFRKSLCLELDDVRMLEKSRNAKSARKTYSSDRLEAVQQHIQQPIDFDLAG